MFQRLLEELRGHQRSFKTIRDVDEKHFGWHVRAESQFRTYMGQIERVSVSLQEISGKMQGLHTQLVQVQSWKTDHDAKLEYLNDQTEKILELQKKVQKIPETLTNLTSKQREVDVRVGNLEGRPGGQTGDPACGRQISEITAEMGQQEARMPTIEGPLGTPVALDRASVPALRSIAGQGLGRF